MDSLHVSIALGPLAMYLLVLGAVNLAPRPLLTTGARDAAALALAVVGLVVVGPMELFLVEEAAVLYGAWVWAIMLAAYALGIVLLILAMRPRLILYNATAEQLRPVLAEVVGRLDAEARWAGECLVLPQLGVQLHLEATPLTKVIQLVAAGSQQNLYGWRRLERELAGALRRARSTPNPYGISLISFGVLLTAAIAFLLARDPAAVTQALQEMLRQ